MITKGASIAKVEPGGIAAEIELQPGDKLLKINGCQLVDFIDYLFLTADESLTLEVLKASGELWEVEVEKEAGEPLGLNFEELVFDQVRSCANDCLFCFVHQLPEGQRSSLYVKDDDYRLSFLQGNYITLTNLTRKDWDRIVKLRLSPLYISVHATEPEIRKMVLGSHKAAPIIAQLKRLAAAGITVHTQAVLCPGINDGAVLEKTIRDLSELWPNVASLAVVPVGLTQHRQSLYQLRPYTQDESREVLNIVRRYQSSFLEQLGSRFVFAADEWYLNAAAAFPGDAEYEDYLQLDNGVGLIRHFLSELERSLAALKKPLPQADIKLVIVTGVATGRMWDLAVPLLRQYFPGMMPEILAVTNDFFGKTVTVTGLLTGGDIRAAIQEHAAKAGSRTEKSAVADTVYLIPRITMKADQELFLDGLTFRELQQTCAPQKIMVVPSDASSWIEWLYETFVH